MPAFKDKTVSKTLEFITAWQQYSVGDQITVQSAAYAETLVISRRCKYILPKQEPRKYTQNETITIKREENGSKARNSSRS